MKTKDSIEFYNKESNSYESRRWSSAIGQIVNQAQLNIIKELSNDRMNGRILEVAAGTGRFTEILLADKCKVTALDAANEMLSKLLCHLKTHPNILFLNAINADARKLPIKSGVYDTVICVNALSHIPDHRDVLSEIYRVLNPNGVFICNFPNYLSPYLVFGLYVNLRKKAVVRDVYTRWYTLRTLVNDLSSVGFNIEDLQGELHYPSWIPAFFSPLAKYLDKMFRRGRKANFAPIIFLKCRK